MSQGYQVNRLEGHPFKPDNRVFKDYMAHYFNEKKVAKGIARGTAKLILNTLYGRFVLS